MTAALADRPVVEVAGGALYPVALRFDSAFGRCVGVGLAAALDADPATLVPLLHREERPLCRTMRGARLVEFVGGRIAARLAREGMSGGNDPTLVGACGMPTTTKGVSISISHSRRLAVALAHAPGCSVGVDVEPLDEDENMDLLAERILSDEERSESHSGGETIGILRRLSLKEAACKALFPRYGHVPLRQIPVLPSAGPSGFRVLATRQRIPVEVASREVDGQALSLARVM